MHVKQILNWLDMMIMLESHVRNKEKLQFKYHSIHEFVRMLGKEYAPRPEHVHVKEKEYDSFFNTFLLLLSKDVDPSWLYCEGFSCVDDEVIHSAWLVDSQYVIDNTRDKPADWYAGVPFPHHYLKTLGVKIDMNLGIINNPEMDYPLLTGEHEYVNQQIVKERI